MASINVTSTSTTSFTVQLTGLDTAYSQATRTCYWYIGSTLKKTQTLSNNISSSTPVTLSGLSAGTTYSIKAVITASGWTSDVTVGPISRTTDDEEITAYFELDEITSSSVTVKIGDLVRGQSVVWYVRLYSSSDVYEDDFTATSTTHYRTCTGLLPDTRYATNVSVNGTLLGQQTFWTDPEETIELWDWQSSNGNASAAQTRTAYSAITSNGYTGNFSYLVWNDLVDKVLEVYDYTGGSWSSAYATASATKMTSSNKTMTALRFNSLKYNIQRNVSTGISDRSAGDIVYGSYFVTLANKINVWINSL